MVTFKAVILRFESQGEKTGWSYIQVPADIAQQLMPDNKKTFRVKGKLDNHAFQGVSLLPMGGGDFIMALNGDMRKAIRKSQGATLQVTLALDKNSLKPPAAFVDCLADEPKALEAFNKLSMSHRNYFIKWITSAKTDDTQAKRIANAVTALAQGVRFDHMLRKLKQERKDLLG